MMRDEIRVKKLPDGRFAVTVDGASKECDNWPDALATVESEGGTPLARAHKEMFDKLKIAEEKNAELVEMLGNAEKDRDRYKEWWYKLHEENRQLKAAICKWFLRAFKEGKA